MHEEEIERTPWFLRLFGKPRFRRKTNFCAHVGGIFWDWEYLERPPCS